MSSWHTHLIIGAAGGLAANAALHIPLWDTQPIGPYSWHGGAFVVASALLALWPDIDEPNSMASRQLPLAWVLLFGVGAACYAAWVAQSASLVAVLTRLLLIALLSPVLLIGGPLLLRALIDRVSGGHRRTTHSVLTAAVLISLGVGLWAWGWSEAALLPWALAWGIVLHDLGDIVTPSGLMLWWPLSTHHTRLPRAVARWGEPLIAIGSLGLSGLLLWQQVEL